MLWRIIISFAIIPQIQFYTTKLAFYYLPLQFLLHFNAGLFWRTGNGATMRHVRKCLSTFFIFKSVERRNDIVSDFLSCICGRWPPEAPVMGERAGGKNIMKSVYPRWFLTLWNSRKISIISQGLSNDGCPWICNYLATGMVFREEYCRRHWLHIQA